MFHKHSTIHTSERKREQETENTEYSIPDTGGAFYAGTHEKTTISRHELWSSKEKMTLTVAVGSSNPAKIRSVQQALEQIASVRLEMKGFPVESGVPDQPMNDQETKEGAKNRARAAFKAFILEHSVEPDLAVGLEGGLEEQGEHLACMAWMAVYGSRSNKVLSFTKAPDCGEYTVEDEKSWGLAKTASFVLPPKVTRLIKEEGMELGHADDAVFSRIKSKHGSGTVGILTNSLIDRSKYYEHALILALVPWIRPDLYPTGN